MSTVSSIFYPMKWFLRRSYGLDRFANKDRPTQEWRLYFGILFEFLD